MMWAGYPLFDVRLRSRAPPDTLSTDFTKILEMGFQRRLIGGRTEGNAVHAVGMPHHPADGTVPGDVPDAVDLVGGTMGMDAQVQAPRLGKPSWKDPRLFVGILLVLASVASVVSLVGGADKTAAAYVARDALVVGQPVTVDSFDVVQVRLGDVDAKYLAPANPLPAHAVAVRMVPKGELVSLTSIGGTDALNRKPASVTVGEPLPKEVVVGSHVDVWVALPDERNGYSEPVLMLPGAEVAALNSSSSGLGSSKSTQLMVLVTDSQMPKFLGAVANKAKVSVVWNPGAAQ
jgi:hypothetical protein